MLSQISDGHIIVKELKRKALHIGVGLTALSFPLFLNDTWTTVAACGLAVVWLLAVRYVPVLRRHFGSVLHGVRRRSLGEIYFAVSIACLLLLTQGQAGSIRHTHFDTDTGGLNRSDRRQVPPNRPVEGPSQGQDNYWLCRVFCRRFHR